MVLCLAADRVPGICLSCARSRPPAGSGAEGRRAGVVDVLAANAAGLGRVADGSALDPLEPSSTVREPVSEVDGEVDSEGLGRGKFGASW